MKLQRKGQRLSSRHSVKSVLVTINPIYSCIQRKSFHLFLKQTKYDRVGNVSFLLEPIRISFDSKNKIKVVSTIIIHLISKQMEINFSECSEKSIRSLICACLSGHLHSVKVKNKKISINNYRNYNMFSIIFV